MDGLSFIPFVSPPWAFQSLTVGVRDVGPEHVVLAVDHLVHLLAVPQQLQVHQTRLVPGRERAQREENDISREGNALP